MYGRDDIDRVRAATNLIDLVAAVTTVKRQGRAHMAVCPFHQEKSASLSLDPARGLYHCFGCGKSGDVLTFIQDTQGLDFNESLELLARQAGIQLEVDPAAAKQRGERDQMVEAVRHAADFYHRTLKNDVEAGPARAYLRSRGIDAATVDEYRIGFAPEGDTWGALVKELRGAGIKDRTMESAGLARRGRGGRLYDLFRRRVLFPIHDLRGEPVGFGGRGLEGVTPKYLNSPDSRLYQKSRLLYGLHRAKGPIARTQEAVVVEGYFDVIACNRAGVDTAVATCGTALGEDHFDLLRRFTDRVVLAFDSDAAGGKAALRGDDLVTPVDLDLDLRVAEMPDGLDPADLFQTGRGSELAQAVKSSRPLLQFRIEKEVERFDLREPEARARAVRRLVPLLARVSDEIARAEYVRFAAGLIGIEPAALERSLRGGRHRVGQVSSVETIEQSDPIQRELLRVVLANPVQIAGQEIGPELFSDVVLRKAFESIVERRASTAAGVPIDIAGLDQTEVLQRIALDPRPLPGDPVEVLVRTRHKAIEAEIEELKHQMARLDPASQGHSDILRRVIALEQERRN
ncbi:MAG TPA: DNA primase [Acidimicrobiia bacterium]|nr:DNA primase [Acidimicrobiia bacterium]